MRRILQTEKPTWQRCARLAGQLAKFNPGQLFGPFATAGIHLRGEEHPYFLDVLRLTPYPAIRFVKGWKALAEIYARIQIQNFPSPYWILGFPVLEVAQMPLKEIAPDERLFLERTGLLSDPKDENEVYGVFHSTIPGYLPWVPDAAEGILLERLLEGTLGILLRVEKDAGLLDPRNGGVLVIRENESGRWEDTRMEPVPFAILQKTPEVPKESLDAFSRLPMIDLDLELELLLILASGQHPRRRPSAFFALVGAESHGTVFYGEALSSSEGFDKLWEKVPGELLRMFQKIGGVPTTLQASSQRLLQLLHQLAIYRPFKLVHQTKLTRMPKAAEAVNQFFLTKKIGS
ncbi:MAG: hypothetical protein J6Z49_00605 [Kiritimatiellae bacterium]|nr:hypothetical protein [Kiritimatiellia bacterium]